MSSGAVWKHRGSLPTRSVRASASISAVRCRIVRSLRNRGISLGCLRHTHGMPWRASTLRAKRRHLLPSGRHLKKRSASASRAIAAHASFVRLWCKRSSTASSPPGCCGRARFRHRPARSTGERRYGTCGRRFSGRCFSNSPILAGCNRLGLVEVLDWTAAALDRVNRPAFFARFREGAAVPYFYEPFLEAFRSRAAQATRRLVHAGRGRAVHGRSRRQGSQG